MGLAFLIDQFIDAPLGAALLNMAVTGAVISYAIVMIDFVVLRIRKPELPRPYKSPLGIAGGVVGAILAIMALVSTLLIEAYRIATIGILVFIVVMFALLLLLQPPSPGGQGAGGRGRPGQGCRGRARLSRGAVEEPPASAGRLLA